MEWIRTDPTFAEWLIGSIFGNNNNTRSLINFIRVHIFLQIDKMNEHVFLLSRASNCKCKMLPINQPNIKPVYIQITK